MVVILVAINLAAIRTSLKSTNWVPWLLNSNGTLPRAARIQNGLGLLITAPIRTVSSEYWTKQILAQPWPLLL